MGEEGAASVLGVYPLDVASWLDPASVGPSLGHLSPPRWPHGARPTAHVRETQRDSVSQLHITAGASPPAFNLPYLFLSRCCSC